MAAASAPKVSTLSLPALLTIICGILACLPFIGEWAVAKTYRTHRRGVVFIAGAGEAPMGHHAVSAMIEDGYLVFAGVKSEDEANALPKPSRPNMLRTVLLDPANPESVDAAVGTFTHEVAEKDFGALIVVSPMAGVKSAMETHDIGQLTETFDINVFESVRTVQKFLPVIRQHGARIVFMSTACAHLTTPLYAGICASKAALEAIGDGFRRELAPYSISVSSIEPVATPDLHEAPRSPLYEHLYAEDKPQGLSKLAKEASTASTMLALVHSVSSTHPRIRYVTGKPGGILPEIFMDFVAWVLPGRVVDALLT